jgi:general secretion pathway protein C
LVPGIDRADNMQLNMPSPRWGAFGLSAVARIHNLLAHRAVQGAATLAALLLLSWGLAQWTWRVWQPAVPVITGTGGTNAIDLGSLTKAQPFGPALPPARGADVPLMRSPMNLLLTGVAVRQSGGCALVVAEGGPEFALCTGEDISPGVRLVSVHRDRIVISRGGAREAVMLRDAEGSPGTSMAGAPTQSLLQSVGSNRHVVDRRQLQQQLSQPEFLKQALIVPNPQGGGFLVRELQKGSLYEKAGLRAGDLIRSVNGQPLTNMDDLMRLYRQFGSAERLLVDVQREGRSETLYYDMR